MTAGRSNTGLRKRHALQLFKTDMCKFFLQSRCENGDKCSYAHTIDEVRRKPDLTRTSMCKAMVQAGVCTDMSCRFAHSEVQLRATHGFFKMKMCGFVQAGRCKHGKNCRFAHSREELRPAKPPPPGTEDDLLLVQQPLAPPVEGSAAVGNLPSEGSRSGGPAKDVYMKDFIFGVLPNEEQPPPPPPAPYTATQPMNERRLQRRQAAAAANQQKPISRPAAQGGTASGRSVSTGEVETALAGASSTLNESDSSPWASGSSATEVPRSEHTGSSPPTMSDSSSGAGAGSSGMLNTSGSTSANGSGSGSGELRLKAKDRRPTAEKKDSKDSVDSSSAVTTLMVTHIPTYLTQGALLSMFEDLTYAMRENFDFYYCPWDETMHRNLGYAIMNFIDCSHAAQFQQTWANKELCSRGRGQKPLRVMKASLQGLQANIEYFSKVEIAPCADMRFRPLYRDANGVLQPLPRNAEAVWAELAPPMVSEFASPTVSPDESALLPKPPATIAAGRPPGPPWRQTQQRTPPQQIVQGHEVLEGAGHFPEVPADQSRARRTNRRLNFQPAAQQAGLGKYPSQQCGHPGDFQAQLQQCPVNVGDARGASTANIAAHKDYWSEQQAGGDDVMSGATQQVLTWPVMMTAMPWPMAEQMQKPYPADGKSYRNLFRDAPFGGNDQTCDLGAMGMTTGCGCGAGNTSMQEMAIFDTANPMTNLRVNGQHASSSCDPGHGAMQAQYPHLVPYIVPMEAMGPVEREHMNRTPLQSMVSSNMHMMQNMAVAGMWPDNAEVYTD